MGRNFIVSQKLKGMFRKIVGIRRYFQHCDDFILRQASILFIIQFLSFLFLFALFENNSKIQFFWIFGVRSKIHYFECDLDDSLSDFLQFYQNLKNIVLNLTSSDSTWYDKWRSWAAQCGCKGNWALLPHKERHGYAAFAGVATGTYEKYLHNLRVIHKGLNGI